MPLTQPRGAGKPSKRKIAGPKPPKATKAKKAKAGKATKARKAQAAKSPKALKPGTFHEQAQSPAGAEHPTTAGLPFAGVGSAAGVSPRAVVELTGLNAAPSPEGLSGAILDLVGEGRLTAARALAAWTHEQDRLANRAWRRPGGLQRMGGL